MTDTGYTNIIEVSNLSDHLNDPDWVIVDCRFELAKPDWGFEDYQESHIPGAVYAHLDHDLSGQRTINNGRHPLPGIREFRETLGCLGIDERKQVVIYDTTGGSFAVRLWWMLKFYGHSAAAVLNGGYQAWLAEGNPVESGIRTNPKAEFRGEPIHTMLVSTSEMEEIVESSRLKIIDSRAPERFRGEIEPLDPVAGHIPGAVNRFHQDNLDPDGRLLPPETLKLEFLDLLGDVSPDQAVVYCGSGVTSCHHLLAMDIAGLPLPKLYAGSWSEWIRNPNHLVALGEDE